MRDQLVRLKELQDIDALLRKMQQEYAALLQAEDVRKLFNQVNDLQRQIIKLEKNDERLTMQCNRAEAELALLQTQKQQMENNLYGGTIQSSKEMLQVQNRIQQMLEQIKASEGKIIECMQHQEDLRQEIVLVQEDFEAQKTQLTEKRRENTATMLKLTTQIKETENLRSQQTETFDAALLVIYNDLARKKGTAVSVLQGDICTGCRVSVPSNKLAKVEEGKMLVYCDTCGRILIPHQ